MNMSLTKCKKSLTVTWFLGAGIIFILILFQTIFGKFSGQVEEAWSWFLPTVMPTLSLVIGVLVMDARHGTAKDERQIDSFLFKLAMVLSIVYFGAILLTILVQPFTEILILELLGKSNLWLGPLQGLVAASLGAFFVGKGKDGD